MIDAKNAKMESLLNSKACRYMEDIENAVNKAIKNGDMSAITKHNIEDDYNGKQLVNAIKNKLEELGYKVDFKFAEPLPSGCPSDQWFSNGIITIKWD